MPFIYNDTDLSEHPVKTYADLLVVVQKAATLFECDDDIKEFYTWLQQVPEDASEDDDYFPCHAEEEEDPDPAFEELVDSKGLQFAITDILDFDLLEAYVVNKKLWVLTQHGLLQLSERMADQSVATIPLWNPNFKATSMAIILKRYADSYTYIYEPCEQISIVMSNGESKGKVQSIFSASTLPEHVKFCSDFNEGKGAILTCSGFSVVIAADGSAYVTNSGHNAKRIISQKL